MLKLLTVVVAGVLTVVTLRRVYDRFRSAQVRVKARDPDAPRAVTRLKKDARTGIYYPES